MNSIQFFEHPNLPTKPPIEWGTAALQSEKFDPTIVNGPTYLMQ
jgi:hypothetical protein